MRSLKPVLLAVGILQLILAAGFFFQQSWATALWPVPDTRLSYAFIAAILAGGAAALIWIALSERFAGLKGYGLGFGIMYVGMALAAFLFYLQTQQAALLVFALVIGLVAVLCALLFFRTRDSVQASQPTPHIVRLAFILEVLVLAGAGLLLLLKVPNTLPWNLSPESSVLYGWVFLGLAFYYLYAVLRPQWIHALGPVLGFLVYDLVLFSLLFARFGSLSTSVGRWQPPSLSSSARHSACIIYL
jgi:hypothetical protein